MTPLELYGRVAEEAAGAVIRRYSSSFGLACRLLPRRNRADIQNIYGLVRIADEVVDGVAASAGLVTADVAAQLVALGAHALRAIRTGYSSNLLLPTLAPQAPRTRVRDDL